MSSSYYYLNESFKDLSFLDLPDNDLHSFIIQAPFSPNALWSFQNPVIHLLLANEMYDRVARLLQLIPSRINPNLCDGKKFGNKSLLIMLSLLPNTDSLMKQFISTYKEKLDFDYQDAKGRTALHYAVILGRDSIVEFLLNSGASRIIKDKNEKIPFEYINCDVEEIKSSLKMIHIAPNRDISVVRNRLTDHHGRPLMLQGVYLTQSLEIVSRVSQSKLTLIKYIEEQDGMPWATFIGDDTMATYNQMLKLANDIQGTFNCDLKLLLVHKQLSEDEHLKFEKKLSSLSSTMVGTSVLDTCILGHSKLEPHFRQENCIQNLSL